MSRGLQVVHPQPGIMFFIPHMSWGQPGGLVMPSLVGLQAPPGKALPFAAAVPVSLALLPCLSLF